MSSYPRGSHRKWVGRVQALLSIVDWPPIPKDGHLKVLHHRVNHLPVGQTQHTVAVSVSQDQAISTQKLMVFISFTRFFKVLFTGFGQQTFLEVLKKSIATIEALCNSFCTFGAEAAKVQLTC